MNQKPIAPGAIGVWHDDAPGNYAGRLWRVMETHTPTIASEERALLIQAVDCADVEKRPPRWWVAERAFWCVLDAGVLEL
jgi:hypothetical protein